ncbi:MAG: hypothetical protein ACREBU_19035 [Nitrososphaera sp.]
MPSIITGDWSMRQLGAIEEIVEAEVDRRLRTRFNSPNNRLQAIGVPGDGDLPVSVSKRARMIVNATSVNATNEILDVVLGQIVRGLEQQVKQKQCSSCAPGETQPCKSGRNSCHEMLEVGKHGCFNCRQEIVQKNIDTRRDQATGYFGFRG